ncbi:hypothetical protein Ade02nite_72430 [Paractinoplanes deccanensis]|uniref:YbaB/EbfC DNA-binding family protein n=1 Tax=Paractinoplanes deccanensis TaxID=113561 RepID=A0ABQ3YF41_9ACTN|nr:hypothetical protein [Actinoplanes deccanensis]GID78602.1 hypothetical protein Ade02nite_72430 [Actinoplanes deccanensis]
MAITHGGNVSEGRFAELADLLDEGEAMLGAGRSAASVDAGPGVDASGSVRVRLDDEGRVAAVTVGAGWRRALGDDGLSAAVVEAARDASVRRLAAWGEAYGGGAPAGAAAPDHGEVQRRLQELATRRMSRADREVALAELLALVEGIERGIDEVSGKLRSTLDATHTGHSPDRHVAVTVSGGGDVVSVRFGREWLRGAHELNVGRQVTAAFLSAYEKAAAHGVRQLIADSPLGAVRRETRDPLGLARRLRLAD